jgi:hypothetical protein
MRTCPFHGCDARIPDVLFACRFHWSTLSRVDQRRISAVYANYLAGDLDVEQLRRIQDEVLGDRGLAAKADGVLP